MTTKRMFISVELPETVKAMLDGLQLESSNISWLNPDQYHITIYFLGEINAGQENEVKKILSNEMFDFPEIDLKLSAVSIVKGRMIWVEVEDQTGLLQKLYSELREKIILAKIGEPAREILAPHILLGKSVGHDKLLDQDTTIKDLKNNFKPFSLKASGVSLFESELRPQGALHVKVRDFVFGRSHS
ncbi:MAG: 2'-5' RNA ligase [Candidatus Doudnabacteria bacterium RIFCSPHIGHO2_02_FULL_46_11]|uniref:RNA 2',3'-cyclic phosphodiesterase n=1 Tax=Candidatus Doudnabacteria bacterium RIFCSPHIGHO2_02_FULL_46_11 TaxID=1817832 RepID=A0A1F5PA81_9BACT|nr:MAG: 2'-5' RNA ligase [Candidatus Doudnabacteria bacterium RIFCSPHIGHO2_02_FULL_46_11]